ncbi:MAG: HAD family hydrolase [Dehalococcoidia bacterium]
MTIGAVIFDFGGVIVPGSPSGDDPNSRWAMLERQHGLPSGSLFDAFYLKNPAWLQLRVGGSSDDQWRAESHAQVAALADSQVADAVVTAVWAARPQGDTLRGEALFNDGMVELVQRLRGRVKVSILSNAAPGLERELREHYRIYDLFDDVINSATVRLAKPDVRIFGLAAGRLGLQPSACFFTDDLAHNVEAARSTGMQAHQFLGYAGLAEALIAAGLDPS